MRSGLMKVLDNRNRREAEPLPNRILKAEATLLGATRHVDGRVSQRRGMTKLSCERAS